MDNEFDLAMVYFIRNSVKNFLEKHKKIVTNFCHPLHDMFLPLSQRSFFQPGPNREKNVKQTHGTQKQGDDRANYV